MHAHSVTHRWQKVVIAAIGILASLALLGASMRANYKFGYSLGRAEMDGMMYGIAAVSADVFMALSPFFFFAAWKAREPMRYIGAAMVWIITTAVAFTSLIGHASVNRIDVMSHRETAALQYKDVRTELEEARKERGFIPQARPEAAVKAEVAKWKVNTLWTASSECQEITGAAERKYCAAYQALVAELGNAMQAAKVNARIEVLQAKADHATDSGAAPTSEADPQATTVAYYLRTDVRTAQSALIGGVVLMILGVAGLGPYVSMSILLAPKVKVIDVSAEIVNLTTEDQKLLAQGAIDIGGKLLRDGANPASEGSARGVAMAANGLPYHIMARLSRPPLSGAIALLREIDYPVPPVKLKGELRHKHATRDGFKTAAKNFALWLQSYELAGVYEPAQFYKLYLEFCKMDRREPIHENMLLGACNDLHKKHGVVRATINKGRKWVVTPGKFPEPKAAKTPEEAAKPPEKAQDGQTGAARGDPPSDAAPRSTALVVPLRRLWKTEATS